MHYLNYKEIKPRGTLEFPIEYYHINSQHPQYEMPYHWHEELELIHVLEGSISIHLDKHEYTANEGDLLIVNGGVLHGGTPIDCVYECLVLNTNLLSHHISVAKYFDKLEKQQLSLNEYFPYEQDDFHILCRRLFHAMSKKEQAYQLTTIGCLYQLFAILFSNYYYAEIKTNDLSSHKHIALLKQVLQYIENSYAEKITLEQLSKLAGMSAKYFCRFFYEMTHRTPMDYLNFYRIERACLKLVSTNLTITEVALECGFNDLSYFIKTFKKYKSITPKQYLKAPLKSC